MTATSTDAFLETIRESELLSEEQLKTAESLLASQANPRDGAIALIREGFVTSYQASMMLQGRSQFRLGKYVIVEPLASGELGGVFLAEHRQLDRRVMIKLLGSSYAKQPESVKSFLSEARKLAGLDHRHIAHVLDIAEESGRYYLVLEHVEGDNLQSRIDVDGPLDEAQAAGILQQVMSGLDHAHTNGIIHGELRPEYLLRDENGQIKIFDASDGRVAPIEKRKELLGEYLAPELRGDAPSPPNVASDLYALGAIARYLTTGSGKPDDSEASIEHSKNGIQGWIKQLTATEPSERPESVRAAANLLKAIIATAPAAAAPPPKRSVANQDTANIADTGVLPDLTAAANAPPTANLAPLADPPEPLATEGSRDVVIDNSHVSLAKEVEKATADVGKPLAASPAPPKAKAPKGKAPTPKEPVAKAPDVKAPAPKQRAAKAPIAKSPEVKVPASKAPVAKEPVAKEPAAKEPAAKEPVAKEPVAKEPVAKEPVAKEPVAKEPVAKEPVAKEPTAKEPATKAPKAKEPVAKAPAKKTAAVLTAEDDAPTTAEASQIAGGNRTVFLIAGIGGAVALLLLTVVIGGAVWFFSGGEEIAQETEKTSTTEDNVTAKPSVPVVVAKEPIEPADSQNTDPENASPENADVENADADDVNPEQSDTAVDAPEAVNPDQQTPNTSAPAAPDLAGDTKGPSQEDAEKAKEEDRKKEEQRLKAEKAKQLAAEKKAKEEAAKLAAEEKRRKEAEAKRNPFEELPTSIDIAFGEAVQGPQSLGKMTIKDDDFLNIELLGGDSAKSGKYVFSMEEDVAKPRNWTISLTGSPKLEDGTPIALLSFSEDELQLTWNATAVAEDSACGHLRNCLLDLNINNNKEHTLALRTPVAAEPFAILILPEPPARSVSMKASTEIDSPPPSDSIRVEFKPLAKDVSQPQSFAKDTNSVGVKESAYLQFGAKDAAVFAIELEVSQRADSINIDGNTWFAIANVHQSPAKFSVAAAGKILEFLNAQAVPRRARKTAIERKQDAASKAETIEIKKQLKAIEESIDQYTALETVVGELDKQAFVHYRIIHTVGGKEVVLADTGGQPADAKE